MRNEKKNNKNGYRINRPKCLFLKFLKFSLNGQKTKNKIKYFSSV